MSIEKPQVPLSRWGFGTYRWSATPEHVAALRRALELGCTLVDSAPNYASADVRAALGRLLAPRREQVHLISKGGYADDGGFSLDPAFLQRRIRTEAEMVGGGYLDTFLLHNPEHLLASQPRARVMSAVAAAFEVCALALENGWIHSCGVSSNVLPDPASAMGQDTVEEYAALAAAAGAGGAFRYVQFPFNIVERSACANGWLDRCRALGLITIGNRPLSIRTAAGPVRIADAPPSPTSDSEDLIAGLEALEPGLGWLVDHWAQVASSDALDYVEGLAWSQVSPTSSSTTSHRLRELFAVRRLELRHAAAEQTQALLASPRLAGTLDDPEEPIAVGACRANLDHVDHILVGLRTSADVDQLRPLLTIPPRTADVPAMGLRDRTLTHR